MKKTSSKPRKEDVESGRAISIRQPYIEQILNSSKKYEYRSRQTHIRGRVYLYASMGKTDESNWEAMGLNQGDLDTGVIVGSVEIVGCKYFDDHDYYGYKLKNPKRYRTPLKPKNHAQPCFFFPFGEVKKRKAA